MEKTSSDQDEKRDADVIVLGYGPTGKVLSILLAQKGWRVAAVDRWPDVYPLPRAVHYDHEVARILQACGVGETMKPLVEPMGFYTWLNADREILLDLDWRGTGLSGWPESAMFSQPDLERVLAERAANLPGVTLHAGQVATALEMDAKGARLTLQPAGQSGEPLPGSASQVLTAPWIIGCDGANSFLRQILGIERLDLGFDAQWIVVDIKLNTPRVFSPLNSQLCDPARPTTVVSGGPGRRRWEFMLLPGETREEMLAPDRIWELLAAWDVTSENAMLERAALYRFQATLAKDWRQGRALLAGDACHTTPPFAGQGICAGLRDAAALAWRLDLVLQGACDPTLLDSYQAERAPHVRQLIDFAIELGKVICISDPAIAAERDRVMMAQRADADHQAEPPRRPRLGPGLWDEGSAEGGHLALQAECRLGEATGLQDDVFGNGYALIQRGGTAPPEELARRFAAIGGRIVDVDRADVTGAYADWLNRLGADAVLVRPDFYIQALASREGIAAMLQTALKQLPMAPGQPVRAMA